VLTWQAVVPLPVRLTGLEGIADALLALRLAHAGAEAVRANERTLLRVEPRPALVAGHGVVVVAVLVTWVADGSRTGSRDLEPFLAKFWGVAR
jgi:hypothetical protein